MKIDASEITDELTKLKTWLSEHKVKATTMNQGVETFVSDSMTTFVGEAGDGMRACMKDIFTPLNQQFEVTEQTVTQSIDKITQHAQNEFGGSGIVSEEYLDKWSSDMRRIVQQYNGACNEIDGEFSKVSDLISTRQIDRDGFLETERNTVRYITQLKDKMHEFEAMANAEVTRVNDEVNKLLSMANEASSFSGDMASYKAGNFKFSALTTTEIPEGCDGVDTYQGKNYPYMLIDGEKYYVNCDEPPGLKDGYADDFPYNTQNPNAGDYGLAYKWGMILYGGAFFKNMPDAVGCYGHYIDKSGSDYEVDYAKAYREDKSIKAFVDMKNKKAQRAAQEYYKRTGKTNVTITSAYSQSDGYYPNTENWQKAIGSHRAYTTTTFSQNEDGSLHIKTSVKESDRYDFNKGANDVATGAPDNENGRLAEVGFAKPFYTYGKVDFESDIDPNETAQGGDPNASESTRTRPDRETD